MREERPARRLTGVRVGGAVLKLSRMALMKSDYQNFVSLLDNLVDEVGEDESHPLASLMEIVGVLIENYEAGHVPELVVE